MHMRSHLQYSIDFYSKDSTKKNRQFYNTVITMLNCLLGHLSGAVIFVTIYYAFFPHSQIF